MLDEALGGDGRRRAGRLELPGPRGPLICKGALTLPCSLRFRAVQRGRCVAGSRLCVARPPAAQVAVALRGQRRLTCDRARQD